MWQLSMPVVDSVSMAVLQYNKKAAGLPRRSAMNVLYNSRRFIKKKVKHNRNDRRASIRGEALPFAIQSSFRR